MLCVILSSSRRDLCCTGPLPLSYFRVTAHGAAQAASNPPLALGAAPSAMGRGHQPVQLSLREWGRDVDLTGTGAGAGAGAVDQERVLQTFLLLPDPGVYQVQVRLVLYNVSATMVEESYAMNSHEYEERPGMFVNGFVANARGQKATTLTIPAQAASYAHQPPEMLPLCGAEGGGRIGGRSLHGTHFGMPLAGRWRFQPPREPDAIVGYVPPAIEPATTGAEDAASIDAALLAASAPVDYTGLDKRWLVEHSVFEPYFCRLDRGVSFARALEKVQWVHFTGDSNTRHMFYFVCEMGNGTLVSVDPDKVPRSLDPPHLCVGPSHPDNIQDKDSGIKMGANARWVLTYTNWFCKFHNPCCSKGKQERRFRESVTACLILSFPDSFA